MAQVLLLEIFQQGYSPDHLPGEPCSKPPKPSPSGRSWRTSGYPPRSSPWCPSSARPCSGWRRWRAARPPARTFRPWRCSAWRARRTGCSNWTACAAKRPWRPLPPSTPRTGASSCPSTSTATPSTPTWWARARSSTKSSRSASAPTMCSSRSWSHGPRTPRPWRSSSAPTARTAFSSPWTTWAPGTPTWTASRFCGPMC